MMAKVLSAGNLTDIHAHKHGQANIATYIRGRRQVDYCFASPRILYHVLLCGFEAFHTRKVCDHLGYFVGLSMIVFLQEITYHCQSSGRMYPQ